METDSLLTVKSKAGQLFDSLDWPSFKYGQGLRLYLKIDFDQIREGLWNQKGKSAGVRIKAPSGVTITSLSQLEKEGNLKPEWLEKYYQKLISPGENKLAAMHYYANPDATVIIIGKNKIIKDSIIIENNVGNKAGNKLAGTESFIIIAEENSQANILEIKESSPHALFSSQMLEVYLHPRAKINYSCLHNLAETTLGFALRRGEVQEKAELHWNDIVLGGKYQRMQTKTELIGRQAAVQDKVAFFGSGEQQFELSTEAWHQHSHTNSSLLTVGALDEKAKVLILGKIKVNPGSSKCQGKQRAETLLLGKETEAQALPTLEIENNDVHCVHGAAIGPINQEQLFYLQSKGFSEEQARQAIVEGFLGRVVETISDEEMKNKITSLITDKLISTNSIKNNPVLKINKLGQNLGGPP